MDFAIEFEMSSFFIREPVGALLPYKPRALGT